VTKFIDLTLNGISTGAIYAAVALSLVLIWRATRIVNFAQGAMLMFTTFIASAVINSTGSYVLGLLVALASGLVLGAVVERVVMRPVESAPPLNAVIVALGVYTLLVAVAGMIWGNTPRSFPAAFSLRGYEVGGTRLLFSPNDSFIVLVVIAAALGLALLFQRTSLGLRMRAAAFQPEVARMLGVRANRVIGVAVLLSGALAAVVAVMLTVQNPLVTPDFALRDTIIVLAGVVLGGMNRPIPATLGGFAIGFATGLLGGALPTNQSQYVPAFVFGAVILVLLVRPGGLFTRGQLAERV